MSDIEPAQESAELRQLSDIEVDDVSGGISGAAFVFCSAACAIIMRALHLA